MTYNRLLEEYSPAEARNAGEFGFIEWLFLLYEIAAVILILGTLVKILDITYVWPVLDVVSQNAPAALLTYRCPARVLYPQEAGYPLSGCWIPCSDGGLLHR